jgi:hypothetical protein
VKRCLLTLAAVIAICGAAAALEAQPKQSAEVPRKVLPGMPGSPEYDYGVCMEFHHSDKACRYSEARP